MTLIVLRPTGDVIASMTTVGAASPYQALWYDSDATYVQSNAPGRNTIVDMTNIGLPAAGVTRGVRARLRQSQGGGAAQLVVWIRQGENVLLEQVFNATNGIATASTGELALR